MSWLLISARYLQSDVTVKSGVDDFIDPGWLFNDNRWYGYLRTRVSFCIYRLTSCKRNLIIDHIRMNECGESRCFTLYQDDDELSRTLEKWDDQSAWFKMKWIKNEWEKSKLEKDNIALLPQIFPRIPVVDSGKCHGKRKFSWSGTHASHALFLFHRIQRGKTSLTRFYR